MTMPSNRLPEFIKRLASLEQKVEGHLVAGVDIIKTIEGLKADVVWLKWLNMGIAALVLFKLVADWVVRR